MDLDGKGLFIAIEAVTIGLVFEAKQLKYVVLWLLLCMVFFFSFLIVTKGRNSSPTCPYQTVLICTRNDP